MKLRAVYYKSKKFIETNFIEIVFPHFVFSLNTMRAIRAVNIKLAGRNGPTYIRDADGASGVATTSSMATSSSVATSHRTALTAIVWNWNKFWSSPQLSCNNKMECLIAEVQKRSILWNKKHPRFTDRIVADKEWDRVAQNTEFTSMYT